MNHHLLSLALLVGCSTQASGDDSNDPVGLFDACGGKIVSSTGAISADEYRAQAVKWDRATLDCRLGPNFAHYHPDDADAARPTAFEVPHIPHPGGYLCPEFTSNDVGPATYGSTSGQVAYSPDDPSDPGIDRIQTSGWEGNGTCLQPIQGRWLGGPHPDPAVSGWGALVAGAVPVAKARTEYSETGDGVVVFSNGLVGTTGTQTSGSSHPTLQLPPNKIPFAVAITNYNEFALVAVWDTDALMGQLAVIALRAPSPGSFSIDLFAAPNEGGFAAMHLLGFVDLPDMATPTAIAIAGNNQGHNGPWVQSGPHAYQGIGTIFADLRYASMIAHPNKGIWFTDPASGQSLFATTGGAIIASQWENKVTFVDLTPLFEFVRTVYVAPIENETAEALYTMATAAGSSWPFDFTTNPEMKPTVITTTTVPAPRVVRYGINVGGFAKGIAAKLLAWVGSLDGTLTAFDVSSLSGRSASAGVPITAVGTVSVDPNPTSMHLNNANDQLFVSSRGGRSVQWITAGETSINVTETFRDSRIDDPVATDHNQRTGVITIGDFTAGTVSNFDRKDANCTDDGAGGRTCNYDFEGKVTLPGAVYWVDTANVN